EGARRENLYRRHQRQSCPGHRREGRRRALLGPEDRAAGQWPTHRPRYHKGRAAIGSCIPTLSWHGPVPAFTRYPSGTARTMSHSRVVGWTMSPIAKAAVLFALGHVTFIAIGVCSWVMSQGATSKLRRQRPGAPWAIWFSRVTLCCAFLLAPHERSM